MTHYDPVLPIRNLNNFAKIASFYFGPCATAFLQTYRWLYKRTGSPEHIIDHYNSFSGTAKERNKMFNFDKGDITKLEDIKQNPNKINKFDITLLYKLIQYGTGSNKLASPNDNVWSKNCPVADADKLEHLLFLVKKGRNDVGHVEDSLKNLSDNYVTDECNNLIGRLSSIIKQSGEMAEPKIDQSQINEIKKDLKKDLERIRDEENQLTNLPTLLSLIKKDLVDLHKEDLKRSFENELRGYCPPNLKADQSECTTENLLSTLNSQILIIDGESGMGKTSLTKYLFCCWLLDETEKLELSCYEVIFRIDCRDICSRDISQFLEDELPNAHQYWSNTESLKKHLKKLKVLWIMDGFDESTSEFNGFLGSLQKNMSSKHTIVVTTRPDCVNTLKENLNKDVLEFATEATLEPFTSKQVDDGAKKYLGDKVDEFYQFYKNLDDETKNLMKTPGNLNLCLNLWTHNPDELKGKLTMHKLYEKISLMQVNQLVERHRGKTNIVNKNDLKSRVEKWFYDVLCKIAAESFISYFKFTISNFEQKRLKDEAMEFHLIENYCMSSFLNAEQSHGGGLRYVYRHRTQQEVLASLYLRKSVDNKILKLLENTDPDVWICCYVKYKIDMLKETCNGSDLVRISDLFLDQSRFMEYHLRMQKIWLGILEDAKWDDEFCKAFRTIVSKWPKPFVYWTSLIDLKHNYLERIITKCLPSDVSELNIIINLFPEHKRNDNVLLEDALRNLIEDINKYKKDIAFEVTLKMTNLNPDLLIILKQDDTRTLVKKIWYSGPPVQNLKALFDFPNLEEMKFIGNSGDDDIVSQLASINTKLRFLPSFLHHSCVVHFNQSLSNNWIEKLSSFLSLSKKFCKKLCEVSFDLFFDFHLKNLPKQDCNAVISKCIRLLDVKVLEIKYSSTVPPSCILFRLVNILKLETVYLVTGNEPDDLNTLDYENLFKLWNYSEQKQKVLKEVAFFTDVKNLKTLYEHIPKNLIGITSVYLSFFPMKKEEIPEFNDKRFKRIYFTFFKSKEICSITFDNWRDFMSQEDIECFNLLKPITHSIYSLIIGELSSLV